MHEEDFSYSPDSRIAEELREIRQLMERFLDKFDHWGSLISQALGALGGE